MIDDRRARRAVLEFFDRFIPQLLIAGRYACQVQPILESRTDKALGDEWQSAITDVDIGVQQFFEAFMLAEFPNWDFFGEEHESTSNSAYFSRGAEACVMLDPINGTRLYRDNSPYFDLLVSLRWQGRLVATMSYHPRLHVLYGASAFAPSFMRVGERLEQASPLPDGFSVESPLGVYQTGAALRDAIATVHPVFDFSRDYRADDPRCALNSLFDGKLAGYLMLDCAILDVGATAFAVTRAGGVATRPDGTDLGIFGDFDPTRREDLLVVAEPALHEKLVRHIRSASAYTCR